MSSYIWRGMECSNSPNIQPSLSYSVNNFSAGFWGAYNITGEKVRETDFYISEEFGPLNVSLWDYWNIYDTIKPDFFDYTRKTGCHSLEAQVIYESETKIPFSVIAAYFFHGAEAAGSLYLEANCTLGQDNTRITFLSGYQLTGTYYAQKPGFVNLGTTLSHQLEITKNWYLPLSISVIYNPSSKKTFLVGGITFDIL